MRSFHRCEGIWSTTSKPRYDWIRVWKNRRKLGCNMTLGSPNQNDLCPQSCWTLSKKGLSYHIPKITYVDTELPSYRKKEKRDRQIDYQWISLESPSYQVPFFKRNLSVWEFWCFTNNIIISGFYKTSHQFLNRFIKRCKRFYWFQENVDKPNCGNSICTCNIFSLS